MPATGESKLAVIVSFFRRCKLLVKHFDFELERWFRLDETIWDIHIRVENGQHKNCFGLNVADKQTLVDSIEA
ncbi:MAG: hypothetical protein ACI87E_000966 [Mariniblastus sp.]|jgi:hypothetical protein